MLKIISKLFRTRRAARTAEPLVVAHEAEPLPKLAPAAGKRKYGKGKRHHQVPKGARRIDPSGNLLEQARRARGIDR